MPFQAREVNADRDARRAGEADAASRQANTVTEAGSTVETSDADVAVFSDAEGGGSQGRPFEEGPPSPLPDEASGNPGGITRDADGNLHVDLEA